MVDQCKRSCLGTLLGVGSKGGPGDTSSLRNAIDTVLSCDRMVHCGDRLECTWLASQLADTMRRPSASR